MLTLGMIGGMDLGIVAVVVLVLFGGAKVGGFMKSLGEGVKEFKTATNEEEAPAGTGSAVTPVSSPGPSAPTPSIVVAQPASPASSTANNEE